MATDPKPVKPDKKVVAPIKGLDATIAKSRKTKTDTKALEKANKEVKVADKALYTALNETYRAFDQAYRLTSPLISGPAGPVPIPYPNITKAKKSTESALKKLLKVQRDHEKTCAKLVKVVGKEVQVLQSEAKRSSGDEAGTLKGLKAAKDMAQNKPKTAYSQVKVYGTKIVHHWTNVDKAIEKIEKKQGK